MNYLDKYKDAYDENFVLDNQLMLNWYPERVSIHVKGSSLLDLGLGHGYTAIKLAERFKRYLVLEGSKEMIDRFYAKFGVERLDIINTWFENFETEEKFDHIAMGFILEHVENPAFILSKYKKFLSPEGSVFVAVPNGESLHRRFGYEAGLLKDMMGLSKADLDFGHRRVFNVNSLKNLIESQGYRVKNVEGIFLKPITTQQIIDLKLSDDILQAMLKVGVNYPELCNSILMEIEPC